MEKQDVGKCGHFSIRGYVAEIRRKDRKICWPFSTVGENKEPDEQIDMLPELHFPKFRWWRCQNCLQNGGASDAGTEIRVVSDSSEENICEGRKGNENSSLDVIGDECCPMICIDININKKEMLANVLSNSRKDIFTSGDYKKSAERNVNEALTTLTCYEAKDSRCLKGEIITKDAGIASEIVTLNSKSGGLIELCKPNSEICEVAGVGFGIRNLKCASNISSEICQTGNLGFYLCKSDKMSEQKREFTCPKLPEPENGENGVSNSVNIHTIKLHSLEFDGIDENEDVDDTHDQHHTKAQKVRLLTDIVRREVLGVSSKIPSSNKIANSDHINTKVTQTEATQEYAGLGLHSVPKSQVPVQENFGKGTMGKKKKRKTPQVEASGSLQMSWSKSAQRYNRDETFIDSAIANSESVNDAFAETGSHGGFKNHLIENKIDEKLIQSKKKNKKPLVDRKTSQDASTGRRFNLFSKTYATAQKYDRKSVFYMKESKRLQVEDRFAGINRVGDASFPFNSTVDAFSGRGMDLGCISNKATHRKDVESEKRTNMPQVEGEDSSMMYQNANVKSTGTEIVPFKEAQDTIMGREFHNSLKFHMATQRSPMKSILRNSKSKVPQVDGGNASLILWKGGMPKEDRVISKDVEIKHVEAAIIPFKNSPDAYSERGVHFGLQSNKVSLRKDSKKLNSMLQAEGGVSPIWPKDYSCACNKENTNDARGHLQVNKNQSDERVNKACEPESLDDIPMEIVELLAKNRHTRRLLEAEYANCRKSCVPETSKNVKNGVNMEFTGVLENEIFGLLQETDSHMQKPQSSYAGGGISSTGGNVEPTEEKLSSYLSHLKRTSKSIGSNINHLDDLDDTEGLPEFLESLERLSSGNQFVDAGSDRNFGIQSSGWNGNLMGYSCSLTCLQPLEAHPTCQIVSRQASCKEAQHVCSPNLADCPSEIDGFQKFATNHQKHSGKFDFEIFKRINAEDPFAFTRKGNVTCPKTTGSSGLYTNEIIPAIPLLRFMDAGVSSRASVNVDGYQKFPNQPSFPQNNRRNFGRTTRLTGQVSGKMASRAVKSQRKKREKSSFSPMQTTDPMLCGSVSGSGNLGKDYESFPILNLQKGSMLCPLQSHLVQNSTNSEVSNTIGISRPLKNSCGTEFCSVNRNPADFSVPEAGNEFTIGGGDLKHRKMFLKRGSRGLINTGYRKRQRSMKLSAMELHLQH